MKKTVKSALLFSTVILGLVSTATIKTTSPHLSITAHADGNSSQLSVDQAASIVQNMTPTAQAILADSLAVNQKTFYPDNQTFSDPQSALNVMLNTQDKVNDARLLPELDTETAPIFKVSNITAKDLNDVFKILDLNILDTFQTYGSNYDHSGGSNPLEVLSGAHKLRSLSITNSNLTGDELTVIPTQSLTSLQLLNNNIRSINLLNSHHFPKLKYLNIPNNHIENLSPISGYNLYSITNTNSADQTDVGITSFYGQTFNETLNLNDSSQVETVGDNYRIYFKNIKDINFNVTTDSDKNTNIRPISDGSYHLFVYSNIPIQYNATFYGHDNQPSATDLSEDGSTTNGVSYVEFPKTNVPSQLSFVIESTQTIDGEVPAIDYNYTINLTTHSQSSSDENDTSNDTSTSDMPNSNNTNVSTLPDTPDKGSKSGSATTPTPFNTNTNSNISNTNNSSVITNAQSSNNNTSTSSNNDNEKLTNTSNDSDKETNKFSPKKDLKIYKTLKSGKKVTQIIKKSSVLKILKKIHKGKKTLYLVEYLDSKTKKKEKGYIPAGKKIFSSKNNSDDVAKVKLLKPIESYNVNEYGTYHKKYSKGSVLKVVDISMTDHTYYLQLSSGKFITANKDDIRVIHY
ncbi:MAG: DUF5776 domain-containing protein [Apilactobacillus sp.]|uniref:DUF5776 domain-containing protein n=1 Tax=Apilactobacillus sp. TaxID=2767901 RepID=UPI0025F989D3|nr:DUF5776 domain-containing protein [Apilactobacillus sp.]MCT6823366.1 DUF5776 domain-containing protein [Apilactobacillus sp.]